MCDHYDYYFSEEIEARRKAALELNERVKRKNKMIFILTERVMNGSVTINTIVTGIEADSFAAAVVILKQQLVGMKNTAITNETEQEISYQVTSDIAVGYRLIIIGNMNNKPLTFLKAAK